MRREQNTNKTIGPEPVLNFNIGGMSALNSVKETVSGINFTSSSNSSTLELGTNSVFGKYYKTKSQSQYNVFSSTYSPTRFPRLNEILVDKDSAFSMLMIIDVSGKLSSGRWGILGLWNVACLIGWAEGSNNTTMVSFPRGMSGLGHTGIHSYYVPTGVENIKYWYFGMDKTGCYFYNSSLQYSYSTTYKHTTAQTGVTQIVLNRAQESTYYTSGGVCIYGITMYDDILTEQQINYLINTKHSTYTTSFD